MLRMFRDKRGIEWDALIIWVLVAVAAILVIIFIGSSKGWLSELVTEIGDIFRFGG